MKKNIAVIFGGRSAEHEVSVLSGLQAYKALNTEKYNTIPIYITKSGQWYTGKVLEETNAYKNIPELLKKADKILLSSNTGEYAVHYCDKVKSRLPFNKEKTKVRIDVALPVTHGTYGEDGALQGLLEMSGIPYAGSNVIGSAVGMDKIMMKHVFRSVGIPCIDFIWFHLKDWIENQENQITEIEKKIKYPVIIKPAIAGSSVGVSKADDRTELIQAVLLASKYCPKIIAEKYISNMMEINCSVMGTSFKQKASVCERPLSTKEILDFDSKYLKETPGKTGTKGGMNTMDRVIPADISNEMTNQIQTLAENTFKELYSSGVARIDFIIDKTDNSLYVNELNGIPGSLSFYLWKESGIEFSEMLDELIGIAIENHRIKEETIYSIDTNLLNIQSTRGSKGVKK